MRTLRESQPQPQGEPFSAIGAGQPNRRLLLLAAAAAGGVLATSGRAAARERTAGQGPTSAQVQLMLDTLAAAPSHGFGKAEFAPADLGDRLQQGDGEAPGLLRLGILAYARAQRGQRIPLDQFPAEWSVRPAPYDPEPGYATALAQDQLQAWIDSLPPPYEGYNGLRKGLARYRAIAADHGWKPIPDGDPLAVGGESGARVVALRRRLAAEDPDGLSDVDGETYDADLAKAVTAFQRRYGLTPDGVVGPPTLTALNMPVGERIQQIKANMERWRWLPRSLPPTRVQVNIAAAVMAVYQDDQPVLAMKAVAGKVGDETPMLRSDISSIVLNPPWHVPVSIATKEIWPKARRDKGYLARNQYVVSRGEDGALHIVQKAGPKSSLGRIKFDFPNPFGVYLHDTPAQAGFARTSRLASHGCVRLEHPEALADLLLQGDPNWPPDRVSEVITTDKTIRVPLARSTPVFILYWTAFVGAGGQMDFRADAYGWDQKLLDLLAAQKTQA